MKVNESFAVKATEEVRKDPRFEWYVNWLKSLGNSQWWSCYNENIVVNEFVIGIENGVNECGAYMMTAFDEILTLDEVYSRYGREIYEANGIEQPKEEQPFQGSREYDEKLLRDCYEFNYEVLGSEYLESVSYILDKEYLNHKYGDKNESILKQIAEHKAKIEELRKQLNSK